MLTKVVRIRQACVGLPTLSRKLLLHLLYYHCETFVHCLAVFKLGDFYELFSAKTSEKFHVNDIAIVATVVLFELNSYTVRWTAVLRSVKAWPKACGVPCSIKFSLNHFLWTLYVKYCVFLRCVASGYCDERAGIKIYCTVLSKYWMVWFKSYSILKNERYRRKLHII